MTAQSDRRKIGMELPAGKRFFLTNAGPMRIQCGPDADMNGRGLRHKEPRGSRAGAFPPLTQEGSGQEGYLLPVVRFSLQTILITSASELSGLHQHTAVD